MPGIKRELASPFRSNGLLGRRQTAAWRVIAALEVVVAAAVVISDFFIATLIVLPLVVISLAIRRQGSRRISPRARWQPPQQSVRF